MHQASPARERLLEGFMLRLAAVRDAEAFALRGGLLVRAWVPERRARDVDLVCSLPYRPREIRVRLRELLATRLDDGVVFDPDHIRIDRVWPASPQPGLKLFAIGEAEGAVAEMTADLTFQLDVWPAATRRALTTTTASTQVWTCPLEMVIGTKLKVIAELGPREWRPKDLADLWLVMRRCPPASVRVLGEAIERCFSRTPGLEPDILTTSWWRDRRAASRWSRFVVRHPAVPIDLDAVIGEVRDHLSPVARQP